MIKKHDRIAAFLLLTVGLIFIVAFAIYANQMYYLNYGPFYDSLSYSAKLVQIMHISATQGVYSALVKSLNSGTVFLPWVFGAILGVIKKPERIDFVILQIPGLVLFVSTCFYYFRKVLKIDVVISAVGSLACVSFSGVFFYNGGLGDFRMDLWQALYYSSACLLFLIARKKDALIFWLLFGLALGAACLVRATTPIYAVLGIGVIVLFDLVRARPGVRKRLVVCYVFSLFTFAAVCLWFFILNFQELYYYYFIWNYDALARLPLLTSIKHIGYVFNHIGIPVILYSVFSLLSGVRLFNGGAFRLIGTFQFPIIWLAISPILLLVLKGAGLNPFVSLVSVPLLCAFLIFPYGGDGLGNGKWNKAAIYLLVPVALFYALERNILGFENQISPWTPSRAEIQHVVDLILDDAESSFSSKVSVAVINNGAFDSIMISSFLSYDRGFHTKDGVNFSRDSLMVTLYQPGIANPAEWSAINGNTGEEKINSILKLALKDCEYIVIPSKDSRGIPIYPIYPYHNILLDRVDDYGFVKISDDISLSNLEKVVVLKNPHILRINLGS